MTMRMRMGFGATTTSPTISSSPTNQNAGCSAAAARPPSSGTIGIRLKRLRKKPTNASATRSSLSQASPATQKAAAPTEPRIGPASATRASFQASSGSSFIPMTAPRKGMKSGALAGTPCRRSSITWPSSWTKIRTTKPIANGRPQSHAYAAARSRARRDLHRARPEACAPEVRQSARSADRARPDLRPAADPLFTSFVNLLLPQRHDHLELVDRLVAGGQGRASVGSGDRDHHARLSDVDPADAMVYGDLAQLVLGLQRRRELGHDLLGHSLVRLVFEVEDIPTARVRARGAGEGRNRAGFVDLHLRRDRLERERLLGEPEPTLWLKATWLLCAARDRRDECDLVARREGRVLLGIRAIQRVEKPVGLIPEAEGRPNVGENGPVGEVELDTPRPRALPKRCKETHVNLHGKSVSAPPRDSVRPCPTRARSPRAEPPSAPESRPRRPAVRRARTAGRRWTRRWKRRTSRRRGGRRRRCFGARAAPSAARGRA